MTLVVCPLKSCMDIDKPVPVFFIMKYHILALTSICQVKIHVTLENI